MDYRDLEPKLPVQRYGGTCYTWISRSWGASSGPRTG